MNDLIAAYSFMAFQHFAVMYGKCSQKEFNNSGKQAEKERRLKGKKTPNELYGLI